MRGFPRWTKWRLWTGGKSQILDDILQQQSDLRTQLQNHPEKVDQREVKLFCEIPKLSKAQITAIRNLNDNSGIVDISVSCQALREMKEKRDIDPSPFFTSTVLFQGIAAVLHQKYLTTESLHLLVECLMLVLRKSPKMSDYVFGLLLRKAREAAVAFDVKCFMSVILYITSSESLGSDCYMEFVELVAQAINSPDREVVDAVCVMISTVFDEDRALVKGQDHSRLIDILQPHLHPSNLRFNHVGLEILAKLSVFSCSPTIQDVYSALAEGFIKFLLETQERIEVVQEECEIVEYRHKGVDMEMKVLGDFADGLFSLPKEVTRDFPMVEIASNQVQYVFDGIQTALAKSSDACIEQFFSSYQHRLSELDVNDGFYDAFIPFLRMRRIPSLARRVIDHFPNMELNVWSPKHSVFCSGTLSPVVASLRNEIIELLLCGNASVIQQFVNDNHKYPVLCAEIIARVLSNGDNISVFADADTVENIASLAVFFQGRPDSENIRNVVMTMMFRLCTDGETARVCFSRRQFILDYFGFLFEQNLLSTVLLFFQNACACLCSECCCPMLSRAFFHLGEVIIGYCTECGYGDVIVKISEILPDIIRRSPQCVSLLSPMVLPMVQSANSLASDRIVESFLRFIASFSQVDESFVLTGYILHLLLSAIRKSGINDSIVKQIMNCLSASYISSHSALFLIQRPSFLPLLFISAPDKLEMTRKLMQLAMYSDWNAGAMHDADLDVLFLDYLATGQDSASVYYAGEEIPMSFTDFERRTVLEPLVLKICATKSSYAVLNRFLELSASNEVIAQMLLRFLGTMLSEPQPRLSIGLYDHVYAITGLLPTDLSSKFTISMWIKIDVPLLKSTDGAVSVVTIDDCKEAGHLEFYLNQMEMYAAFKYGTRLTTVKILKYIPSNEWFMLSIAVLNYQDGAMLVSHVNCHKHMDSDLCKIMLHQGPMKITLGGYNGRRGAGIEIARISDFCIHQEEITDSAIGRRCSGMECCPQLLLLREVTEPSLQYHIRKVTIEQKQRACYAMPLLWYFNSSVFLEKLTFLVKSAHRDVIFGIMQVVFKSSEDVQKQYRSSALLAALLSRENTLNWRTYMGVLTIYKAITYTELQSEWLESILLNIWLWRRADAQSLSQILRIWKTSLIEGSKGVLRKSMFRNMIGEFAEIFQNVEGGVDFGEKTAELRALCVDCLVKIGHISLDPVDIRALVYYCECSSESEVAFDYLRIIRSLCKQIRKFNVKECIDLVRRYVTSDNLSCYLEAVLTIHDLLPDDIQTEILFIDYNNSEEKRRFLYDKLRENITQCPNLYPLVLLISLGLDNESRELACQCFSQLPSTTIYNGTWYFFPILYSFCVSKDSQYKAGEFLASVAVTKENEEIERMFALMTFFDCMLGDKNCCIVWAFIQYLYACWREMPATYASLLNFICMAIAINCFVSYKEPVPEGKESAEKPRMHTINDIYAITYRDFAKFTIEWFELPDTQMEFRRQTVSDILNEMSSWSSWSPDALQILESFHSCDTERRWAILYKHASRLRSRMCEVMEVVSAQFSKARDRLEPYFDIHRNEIIQQVQQWKSRFLCDHEIDRCNDTPVITRDQTLCLGLVPMKLKLKQHSPARRPDDTGDGIQCLLGPRGKLLELCVKRSCLVLSGYSSGSKVIPLSHIECVWKRNGNGMDNEIEFLTSDGRMFLLHFPQNTSDEVLTRFRELGVILNRKTWQLRTDEWRNASISNFEYLLRLNFASGRSFNNFSMYPIFPVVDSDFENFQVEQIAAPPFFFDPSREPRNIEDDLSDVDSLPPEFFCFPEFFHPSDKLPPFAKNEFDLVYQLRKKLESPEVTAKLALWIDKVWGHAQLRCMRHTKLFERPHPSKTFIPPKEFRAKSSRILIEKPLVFVSCVGTSLTLVSNDGTVHFADIKISNDLSVTIRKSIHFVTGTVYARSTSTLFCYSHERHEFSSLRLDDRTRNVPLFMSGKHIVFTNSFVVYCHSSSSIHILNNDGDSLLCYSDARIVCLAVSDEFHAFAYGTSRGELHIVSLPSGRTVKTISLDGEVPTAVLFTKSWGFVIVRTDTDIFVFNINGLFINKAKVKTPIKAWTTFSTVTGFDYVITYDLASQVHVFEAPYPDAKKMICHFRTGSFADASYNEHLSCLSLVSLTGKVKIFRFPL